MRQRRARKGRILSCFHGSKKTKVKRERKLVVPADWKFLKRLTKVRSGARRGKRHAQFSSLIDFPKVACHYAFSLFWIQPSASLNLHPVDGKLLNRKQQLETHNFVLTSVRQRNLTNIPPPPTRSSMLCNCYKVYCLSKMSIHFINQRVIIFTRLVYFNAIPPKERPKVYFSSFL